MLSPCEAAQDTEAHAGEEPVSWFPVDPGIEAYSDSAGEPRPQALEKQFEQQQFIGGK